MRFHFYSPVHFEEWDWRAAERGIGGSETHHIEMANRLAARGHDVVSYAPMPNGEPATGPHGVEWKPLEAADFTARGIWVLYRCPAVLEQFRVTHPGQRLWLVMQDEGYPWSDRAIATVDKTFAFCSAHERATVRRHPGLARSLVRTSNGMKMDLVRAVEQDPPARHPHRLMYASSPDRGLKTLLALWPRVREHVPDAELHCFYGFDNIDKIIASGEAWGQRFRREKDELLDAMEQPGVTWHGRVPQAQLYREWLQTAIWWYPTQFTETSCITCMEAQALGAIPVTAPIWALADNVQHGLFVEGAVYTDPLTQARHVAELVRLLSVESFQEAIRTQMMKDARQRFNWERYVDQWEAIADDREGFHFVQFAFQHKHARGRIANIGCDTDPSAFAARGAVNIDINTVSPGSGRPNPIQVQADARDLPVFLHGAFDTVVLGDILEHMGDDDIVRCLQQARSCLVSGGRVVVTIPNDHRPADQQHTMGMAPPPEYAPGSSCYHLRPLPRAHVLNLVEAAGLRPVVVQEIDYTHFTGHGIVAEAV
jgi:glycosyltransferase involved in cell wall biosynthesis